MAISSYDPGGFGSSGGMKLLKGAAGFLTGGPVGAALALGGEIGDGKSPGAGLASIGSKLFGGGSPAAKASESPTMIPGLQGGQNYSELAQNEFQSSPKPMNAIGRRLYGPGF